MRLWSWDFEEVCWVAGNSGLRTDGGRGVALLPHCGTKAITTPLPCSSTLCYTPTSPPPPCLPILQRQPVGLSLCACQESNDKYENHDGVEHMFPAVPWRAQAIRVMQDQSAGHIFNMDGAGADGNATPRMAAYGASKRSLVRGEGSAARAAQGQRNRVPLRVRGSRHKRGGAALAGCHAGSTAGGAHLHSMPTCAHWDLPRPHCTTHTHSMLIWTSHCRTAGHTHTHAHCMLIGTSHCLTPRRAGAAGQEPQRGAHTGKWPQCVRACVCSCNGAQHVGLGKMTPTPLL